MLWEQLCASSTTVINVKVATVRVINAPIINVKVVTLRVINAPIMGRGTTLRVVTAVIREVVYRVGYPGSSTPWYTMVVVLIPGTPPCTPALHGNVISVLRVTRCTP